MWSLPFSFVNLLINLKVKWRQIFPRLDVEFAFAILVLKDQYGGMDFTGQNFIINAANRCTDPYVVDSACLLFQVKGEKRRQVAFGPASILHITKPLPCKLVQGDGLKIIVSREDTVEVLRGSGYSGNIRLWGAVETQAHGRFLSKPIIYNLDESIGPEAQVPES